MARLIHLAFRGSVNIRVEHRHGPSVHTRALVVEDPQSHAVFELELDPLSWSALAGRMAALTMDEAAADDTPRPDAFNPAARARLH